MEDKPSLPIHDGLFNSTDIPSQNPHSRVFFLLSSLYPSQNTESNGLFSVCRVHIPFLLSIVNQAVYLPLRDTGYSGVSGLWYLIYWLRIDYITIQIGLGEVLLYSVWIGIWSLTALFILGVVVKSRKIYRAIAFGLDVVTTLQVVLMGVLVGSLTVHNTDTLAIHVETGLVWISGLSLGMLWGLSLIRGLATAELVCKPKYWTGFRHCDIVENGVDLMEITACTVLHYAISPINSTLYYPLSALVHLLPALYYAFRQPLYSPKICEERVMGSLLLSWMSVSLQIAVLIERDIVGILLTVVVGAAICGTLHLHWDAIYTLSVPSRLNTSAPITSRLSALLTIRAILLADIPDQERLKRFRALRKLHNNLITVVESGYAQQILGNEALARFLLSGNRDNWYLVDAFFAYRIRSHFHTSQEDIAYVSRLFQLSRIHHLDRSLCLSLSSFYQSLYSPSLYRSRLPGLITSVSGYMREEEKRYSRLMKGEMENVELLGAFGEFLREVMHRKSEAKVFEDRAQEMKETMLRTGSGSDVSLTHPSTCILLVDLNPNPDLSGQIRYCNSAAASTLSYSLPGLFSQRLFSLLPPPFSASHLSHLHQLSLKRHKVTIHHPSILPLLASNGYIKECQVKITITAEANIAVLIVAFKEVNKTRELALLTSEGHVSAHTENFGTMLFDQKGKLEGKITDYIAMPLIPNRLFRLPNAGMVYAKYQEVEVKRDKIRTVAVSTKFASTSTTLIPNIPTTSSQLNLYSQITTMHLHSTKPFTLPLLSEFLSSPSRRLSPLLTTLYKALFALLLTSSLLVLIWAMLMTVFLIDVTESMLDSSVSVEVAGGIVHTVRIAGQGRFLDLTNAGFFPLEMTEDVKNVVRQSVAQLTEYEPIIWSHAKSSSSPLYKSLFVSPSLTMWELEGLTPHPRPKTLKDAMSEYREQSRLLLTLPVTNLTIHNPAVYYVIRNGMGGDLTIALKKSLRMLEEMERRELEGKGSEGGYMVLVVLVLLAGEMGVLVGRLYVSGKSLSGKVMSVSRRKVDGNHAAVAERLRRLHGQEIDLHIPSVTSSSYLLYNPLLHLLPWLFFLPIASILFILLIYFLQVSPQGDYLSHLPTALQYHGLQFTEAIDAWTWTMEAIFMSSSWSLPLALPSPSLQINPLQVISQADISLTKLDTLLFDLSRHTNLPYTNSHTSLLIHATNYTSPIYRKGLKAGFNAYRMDIFLCEQYRGVSAEMYRDCGDLYSAAREMVNISRDVLDMLRTDYRAEALYRVWETGDWLISGAVLSLLYLLLVGIPMVIKSQQIMRRLASLVGLISEEEQGKLREDSITRVTSG